MNARISEVVRDFKGQIGVAARNRSLDGLEDQVVRTGRRARIRLNDDDEV